MSFDYIAEVSSSPLIYSESRFAAFSIRVPAEWERHEATWLAAPYRNDEWPDLSAARAEHAAFVRAIAETERVYLLAAESEVAEENVETIPELAYGDSWTRDTLPVFAFRGSARVGCLSRFDGWGGKYQMPGDESIGRAVAQRDGGEIINTGLTLEGGALEFDGEGTLLSTRECLFPRNPELSEAELLQRLRQAYGVERIVLFDACLLNDHTDGHIDTLARFVEPGHVISMAPREGAPNQEVLQSLKEQIVAAGFRWSALPAPSAVRDREGALLPASYCNYYVCNEQVLVPTYGVPEDDAAVAALASLFPRRRVRGISSRAILEGGGALHCITQQVPE